LKSANKIANAIIPSAIIIHIKLSSAKVELAFGLGVGAEGTNGLLTVLFGVSSGVGTGVLFTGGVVVFWVGVGLGFGVGCGVLFTGCGGCETTEQTTLS
jgi:hypothetical protein